MNLINHSKHHILNRTRWINHCGCTKGHPDDCDEDFQSSFSFEVLGLPSGQIPGFTVSYKQYGRPEVLRFSTFPDIGIATSSRFGQSAHYQSPPLLRVQKATTPSSSPILSFTSFLPSTTIPTSFPSYTQSDQVSDEVHQTSQNILGLVSEPLISSPQTSNIPFIHRVGHEIKEWCRRPGLFTSLGHGIEGLAVKTKSSAQTFLGIFQNIIPSPHLDMSNQPLAVSKEDSNTGGIVSHDEPDDNYQGTEVGSDSFYVDLPNTASSFLDNPISVKAIQAASVAFIIFALSGSILALVCRDPRLRAKLAAAIEENRNQRLYRHAARKRRFQNFVSRFRSKCPDDEEKKANDLASSTVQQSYALNWTEWEKRVSMESVRYNNQEKDMYAISRDLLAFRKAHQFVDSIITTQETRQISGQFRRDRSTRRSRCQRRYSIGSEKTAPPPYESDGEDFILDADGPRYVMIGRSPESSVISTSPRSSCVDSDSEGGC